MLFGAVKVSGQWQLLSVGHIPSVLLSSLLSECLTFRTVGVLIEKNYWEKVFRLGNKVKKVPHPF